MEKDTPYKQCGLCLKEWQTQADFLADPQIRFQGYQPCFGHPEAGLLIFNHTCDQCGSTVVLLVGDFQSMAHGQKNQADLSQDAACPLHCWDPYDTQLCPMPCALAWTREVVQSIAQLKEPRVETPRLHKYP